MEKSRILSFDDEKLLPLYLEIFQNGLREIEALDMHQKLKKVVKEYTLSHLKKQLNPEADKRLVGHFTNYSLDGILIEGFDTIPEQEPEINRTIIKGVIAKQKGQGIGTHLILDSIDRATRENQDVVSLGVSSQNTPAQRLYTKLGFEHDGDYDEGKMLLMHYIVNESIRPKETI